MQSKGSKPTTWLTRPKRLIAMISLALTLALQTTAHSAPTVPAMSTPPASVARHGPSTPTVAPTTTAAPAGIVWSGRLLDVEQGFAYFTTGDSFHLAADASLTDAQSGKPFIGDDFTGLYGRATFTAQGIIRALALSRKPMPIATSAAPVQQFAVHVSTPYGNPELASDDAGFSGSPVLVSFTVQVPITTSLSDSVYMSTEASHWDPMATRMDRVDALHYRITRSIPSGTHVVYRYTRGSWRSSERGRDGLEGPPRAFVVHNLDVARRDDTVYHWSDEDVNGAAPISPDSVPTPFSGGPFTKTHP